MAGRQAKATTIHKYQENFNLPLYHPLGKLCAARPQTSQSLLLPATARGLLEMSALHYGGIKVSQMQGRGEEETETSFLPSMSVYFRRVQPKYIEHRKFKSSYISKP